MRAPRYKLSILAGFLLCAGCASTGWWGQQGGPIVGAPARRIVPRGNEAAEGSAEPDRLAYHAGLDVGTPAPLDPTVEPSAVDDGRQPWETGSAAGPIGRFLKRLGNEWHGSVGVGFGTGDYRATWLNIGGYLIPDKVYLDLTTGWSQFDWD